MRLEHERNRRSLAYYPSFLVYHHSIYRSILLVKEHFVVEQTELMKLDDVGPLDVQVWSTDAVPDDVLADVGGEFGRRGRICQRFRVRFLKQSSRCL